MDTLHAKGKPATTRASISEARANFTELLNRMRLLGERIEITRRGRVVAVIVPPERSAA